MFSLKWLELIEENVWLISAVFVSDGLMNAFTCPLAVETLLRHLFSFICTSIRFIPISSSCCYCIKLIVSSPDRRDQVLYILLFSISMTNANESVSLPFPLLSLAFISFSSSSLFTANNTIYQVLIRPPLVENGGIWTVIGEGLSSILWYKKADCFIISWFPDMFLAEGDKRGRLMGRKAQWLNANHTGTALGSVPDVCARLHLYVHTSV